LCWSPSTGRGWECRCIGTLLIIAIGEQAASEPHLNADILRQVFSYSHLAFMAEAVRHPTEGLSTSVAALLFGSCALYFMAFGYVRRRMFSAWAVTHLVMPAVLVSLIPVGTQVSALVAVVLLFVVVVSFNLGEHARGDGTVSVPQ
jgi:low temperature requirement protein LtrA